MSTKPGDRHRRFGVLIVLAAIAISVPGAVWCYPWLTTRALVDRALHDADPVRRSDALFTLGRHRERRAVGAMMEALARDDDPRVREAAAYALHRIKAPQALPAIAEAIEREADTVYRAKMVVYLARLRGPAALDDLRAWSAAPAVWKSTGAALARIALADPTAAPLLFDRLAGPDAFLAAHITSELKPMLETMMEMIGNHVDLTVSPGQAWSADQVAELRTWWQRHAYAAGKLLADMAVQHAARRGIRRQLARLGGARRRAAFVLGLK